MSSVSSKCAFSARPAHTNRLMVHLRKALLGTTSTVLSFTREVGPPTMLPLEWAPLLPNLAEPTRPPWDADAPVPIRSENGAIVPPEGDSNPGPTDTRDPVLGEFLRPQDCRQRSQLGCDSPVGVFSEEARGHCIPSPGQESVSTEGALAMCRVLSRHLASVLRDILPGRDHPPQLTDGHIRVQRGKQVAQSHTAVGPDLNPRLAAPQDRGALLLPDLASLPHREVPQEWEHPHPHPPQYPLQTLTDRQIG